jgi:hypothetical protein
LRGAGKNSRLGLTTAFVFVFGFFPNLIPFPKGGWLPTFMLFIGVIRFADSRLTGYRV